MKTTNTLTAVVVGHDHQNTLGVIRSLGEGGILVKAVILSEGGVCTTAHSKYIDEVFVIREEVLIDTLIALGNRLDCRIPLIPCGDDTAAPIAQSYDRLKSHFILPSAGDGVNMLRLMNKMDMLCAAREAGLKVPEWVSLEKQDFQVLEHQCSHLHFPCILKPIRLLPGGAFEFRILQSMEQLLDSAGYLNENCASVIIQEYINKTGEYGVNGCRLHRSGETAFGGVIEKKRFSQSSLGSTTAGTILPDAHGLCDAARRFVEHIDYRGIFDMEFITDGKDFYFVEMNFRNGGYGYAYTKAGRNFPAIWVREAAGRNVEKELGAPVRKTFFINESADLQNVRAGNVSLFGWLQDVLRADAHMYINRLDMKPLLKKITRK